MHHSNRRHLLRLFGLSPLAAMAGRVQAADEGFVSLFDGKSLDGWVLPKAPGVSFSVEDGEIVGRTDGKIAKNEFLCTPKSYGDFVLKAKVKLRNGNSGIQFRSQAENGEVSGYQADVGAGWWGKLYEEHGRALLWDKSGEEFVKPGEWNKYEIVAQGDHIRTFINGQPCVDLKDPKGKKKGIIAVQLHSGGKTEVRFRNLRLQLLTE